MSVKPLSYQIQDLGKYMKSSKKKYIWRYEIAGKEHRIELEYSLLSGKRKIFQDGKVLYEGNQVLGAAFQFPFSVDGNNLNIIQQGESFELRINNQVFTHLWQQEKTKSEFQYEEDIPKKEDKSSDPFGLRNQDSNKWGFGEEKKPEESQTDKKLRFSVNLNFGKKDASGKKNEEKINTNPSANPFESSVQMSKSVAFPSDFTNFSKNEAAKKNSDFDFKSFDFNSFGNKNSSSQNVATSEPKIEKAESKFPETDFANLGKFSIVPLKKPPVQTQTQMTQSTPTNTIDLLDLVDEVPSKNETNKNVSNLNTNVSQNAPWDPFSPENTSPQITNNQNTSVNSQPVSVNKQPDLFDLVYTDQLPKEENIINSQKIAEDPKIKETEERQKKLALFDNAFGTSYNTMGQNPQVMNMNMNIYAQQPQPFYPMNPQNFNNNFNMFPNNNAFPPMNLAFVSQQQKGFPNNAFNSFNSNSMGNNGNNLQSTPFDQFG